MLYTAEFYSKIINFIQGVSKYLQREVYELVCVIWMYTACEYMYTI